MNEINLYKIRGTGNTTFNYYFDKITSVFIKSKIHEIDYPKKVMFVRNDHIGDMALTTQVYKEFKNAFPKSNITVLASPGNKTLIEKDLNVDNIIEIDLFWRRGFKGFLDYLKVLKKIKEEKFDIGIDIRRSKLNILFFLFIPKIKTRISYYNINGGKAFLTHPIVYEKKIGGIKEDPEMISKAFKIELKDYMPYIAISKEDENEVKNFLKKNEVKNFIDIAPGATANSKRWPEEKFDKIIELIHKKYPKYKIILSGANSDKELIGRLCENREKICVPLINMNLRQMSIIYKKAKVVVANNGAGTDITGVVNGNLIHLAGPVTLIIDKPLGNTKILHHQLPCYPCKWDQECAKPHGQWCMDLISVDEVMDAVDEFVRK